MHKTNTFSTATPLETPFRQSDPFQSFPTTIPMLFRPLKLRSPREDAGMPAENHRIGYAPENLHGKAPL
jgi:hypothetical protein